MKTKKPVKGQSLVAEGSEQRDKEAYQFQLLQIESLMNAVKCVNVHDELFSALEGAALALGVARACIEGVKDKMDTKLALDVMEELNAAKIIALAALKRARGIK